MAMHADFALLASCDDSAKQIEKNCASCGIQLFQMFSSTSAMLGLSRSSDYSAMNANLNSLINYRRTCGINGQSNMWGQVAGTGLAGSGTGAAGRHGSTDQGAAAHEQAFYNMPKFYKPPAEPAGDGTGEDLAEYRKRENASSDFAISHRESSSPLELQHKLSFEGAQAEGFITVKGMQVNIRTKEKDDKVLVICNLPVSTTDHHDGANWTLKRGNNPLGPKFTTWTNELGRLENVLIPWVDEPGKARFDCDYSVNYRTKAGAKLSSLGERRHLTSVLIPGDQVTLAGSQEACSVQPGRWYDVPGLSQVSVVNSGEKVLVICSIKYAALWSDEETRGRFSIFRDGKGLDPESYGLQSVRSIQKGISRATVMALVDDCEEGAHVYEVKAAVTGNPGEVRVMQICEEERQLALIRLPAGLVAGPYRCKGQTVVSRDAWTEVAGLSVTVRTHHAHEKVLIVWSTNFNPEEFNYEAYFTLFRNGPQGPMQNLGSEEQGMWSVASTAAGSSEFPVAMFTDVPGDGTFTYTVHCRTRRCGSMTKATPVEVGPDGQISGILLEPKRTSASANLVDLMTKEIDAGKSAP